METRTERDDARKPYEPPVVRELGTVAEVTRGVNLLQGRDNAVASLL